LLASKIPKRMSEGGIAEMLDNKVKMSTQELAKLQRYVNAIENPKSVFSDLASGRMSREGAEVLKNVYPSLYTEAQGIISKELGNPKTKLSYQKRLQLGILMDVPADSSMVPQNFLALQTLINTPSEQLKQTGAAQLTADTRMASPTDSIGLDD
jgi:hypothetical protein